MKRLNLYVWYRYNLFPKISRFRGSTRLKDKLMDFQLRNVEKVSEEEELDFEAEKDFKDAVEECVEWVKKGGFAL